MNLDPAIPRKTDRLETLMRSRSKAQLNLNARRDQSGHLEVQKREAWAGLLSSFATGELTERALMTHLQNAFEGDSEAMDFVKAHSDDEARHGNLLKAYVKKTFGFEKKNKTLTDRIVYDRLFPLLGIASSKRPLPFLAGLLFYEILVDEIYVELREAAKKDGLSQLAKLLTSMNQDENRHKAGVKILMSRWKKLHGKPDLADYALALPFLGLIWLDINTRSWARYNSHVRKNLRTLGVNPDRVAQRSDEVFRQSLKAMVHAP